MKHTRARVFLIAILLAAATLSRAVSAETAEDDKGSSLPSSYRSISLGMDLESVKSALTKDGIFGYRGDRDVSLLPFANRSLIETAGTSFIRRSWFQFLDDKLYVMIFRLDPDRLDYYSMYSSLVSKYGEPKELNPAKALWDDGTVTLTLERPLTVKYVDSKAFQSIIDADTTGKAASDILREEFIREF